MKILLLVGVAILALLAIALLAFYVAGRGMPREHVSRVEVTLPAARADVWRAVTDYAAMPRWWPAVKEVRVERRPDGEEWTWNRDARGREVAFRTAEQKVGAKLVREIVGEGLPFGGTWTFEFADAPDGRTALVLTEAGFIEPPVFRAVATWFIGLDANQRDFLKHLEAHVVAAARAPSSAP